MEFDTHKRVRVLLTGHRQELSVAVSRQGTTVENLTTLVQVLASTSIRENQIYSNQYREALLVKKERFSVKILPLKKELVEYLPLT